MQSGVQHRGCACCRDLQWQPQDCTGVQCIYDTIPIEGIVPHHASPLLSTLAPAPDPPLLDSTEDLQTTRMSSVPLPGTDAQPHICCGCAPGQYEHGPCQNSLEEAFSESSSRLLCTSIAHGAH